MGVIARAHQGRPGRHPWPVSQVVGTVIIDGTHYQMYWKSINATTAGLNLIVGGVPGFIIRVVGLVFTCDGNQAVTFSSGTASAATTVIPAMQFAARGGPGLPNMLPGWWMDTKPGDGVVFSLGSGNDVVGFLLYVLMPARSS